MKDCVRFAPMIGARPGELSPEDARALEAHLTACARCGAAAADFAATDGLVREALGAHANARDFAPFVDSVMARISAGATAPPLLRPVDARGGATSFLGWLGRHRRAAAAALAPLLAALALLVYVRLHGGGGTPEVASLEITAQGEATTILETTDGPVVLLYNGSGS